MISAVGEGGAGMEMVEIQKSCILFFVKSPEQTTVKSRLAEAVGLPMAQELYRNFVLDMLDTLSEVASSGNHDLKICLYPPSAAPDISGWLGGSYRVEPQQGNDLGERMQKALQNCFDTGYDRAILLGSDIPDLTSAIIVEALRRLKTHPAVIGPAVDGGYYLVGFQAKALLPAVFKGMPWSAADVYARTWEVFRQTQTDCFVLPTQRDIDTLADLRNLCQRNRESSFARSRTMQYLRRTGFRFDT